MEMVGRVIRIPTNGEQEHEKVLHMANHQGNANQNHNEASPQTCQDGCYQKDKK